MLQTRYFNSLEIDYHQSILKKTSKDKKLQDEINWYNNLPMELRKYIPRIYGYGKESEMIFIKMKYYEHRTLSHYYLSMEKSQSLWRDVFVQLKSLLDAFYKYKIVSTEQERYNSLYDMYIKKTIDRIGDFEKQRVICFDREIIINGKKHNTINQYMNLIIQIAENTGLLSCDEFSLIHGDLCFPNIIYNRKEPSIILVDPRGKFGQFIIYGDRRYDMAKLYHSIFGLYDCIVNDLFDFKRNGYSFDIVIPKPCNYEYAKEMLCNIITDQGIDICLIAVLNIILFLSKIPLHKDKMIHQLIFIIVAIMEIEKIACAN